MKRRAFIAGLGTAAAWPVVARGQQGRTRPIVGMLFPTSEEVSRPNLIALRTRLAELGYVEGRDYDFAVRNAPVPNREAGLSLGGELLALSPAVLVVGAVTSVVLALHQLTSSVPIVMVNFGADPMALGLAASFAHPGGNITGLMISSDPAIVGKQLALLKELAPSIVRVDALLTTTRNEADERLIRSAAGNLNLTVRTFSIASAEQFAPIIAEAKGNTDALLIGSGPLFNTMRHEITELVAQAHLPAAYSFPDIVAAGGLIAYGSSIRKNYRASADYVAKILSGTKPGDLPIQQPTFYDLAINLQTAKALGLEVPPTLLARADEVIE
jgi:putative ABC transport system substrate-binding protein